MRSSIWCLPPAAPLALAVAVLFGHEGTRPSRAEVGLRPARTPQPMPAVAGVAAASAPAQRRRFAIVNGSLARFRPASESAGAAMVAPVTGELLVDRDGAPLWMQLDVDFAALRAADGHPARQTAWEALGVLRNSGRLHFEGNRQTWTRSAVPGVISTTFQGNLRLASTTRHVVIPFRLARVRPDRIRMIGAGTGYGSDFGLPGCRGSLPLSPEEQIRVVWDLALEPIIE